MFALPLGIAAVVMLFTAPYAWYAYVQQVGHSMHGLQEVTVRWYNAQEEEEEGKEQRGWYCGTTDGSEVTTKAK